MPIIRVDGKQICYWIGDKGLLQGREVLLFIHGAGGGQFTWSYQKSFFSREFNPIIIELPGHGESGGEGENEIGRYAEHVYSFVNTLGLQGIFLVGHSMGGAIVQTLALKHPEILQGIILVGTGARLRVFPSILNGIINHFNETVPKIVQFAYSRKATKDLSERGIAEMLRCRPKVLYGDFLACDRFDLMKEVEEIELPTLVVCGEDDELTPVRYSKFLHSKIKHSRLEILSEAGHMVMMESPEAFNEKIRGFIINPTFFENSCTR
jgi:pimeloyl-ACP methyl ester carboxylesterase